MNKAFKVLWNDVRRTYVVSSEAQMSRGKPAKSAKTLVAAAVAGVLALGAGSALAASEPLPETITNESLSDLGTTKFHSGNGQTVNIQTEGDARTLARALLSGDMMAIRAALGHNGKYATMVGTAGGTNYMDSSTLNIVGLVGSAKKEYKWLTDKIKQQFAKIDKNGITTEGDTHIVIGGQSKNPLVVGTIGADRAINANAKVLIFGGSDKVIQLTRVGDSRISMNSGNSLLMTGASSAINIGDVMNLKAGNYNGSLKAEKTDVTLKGDSSIELNGSSSSFGTFTGGSAVALGGKATSTVTGTTSLVINTETKGQGFEGLTIGAMGGGLAVGALGGESTSEVGGDTLVDVKSGLNLGVFGGGLAAAGQVPSKLVEDLIPSNFKDNVTLKDDAFAKGGTATAKSQNIQINLGKDSSNAFVIGGGFAGAYQYDNATVASNATAQAKNVRVVIGDSEADPVFATVEDKSKYFAKLKEGLKDLKTGDAEKAVVSMIDTLADTHGVNVGIMGGGMAMAWSRNAQYGDVDAKTAPKATSIVVDVQMDVLSGYNVGIFGGGFAAASGDATEPTEGEEPSGVLAESQVKSVTMNFAGGETIGVMGGGIAIAAGSGDMNYGTGAVAKVDTVNLNVQGGSVDGLIGGGYAVDDTNPVKNGQPQASKTASSTVGTVNITSTSGTIGRLAFDAIFGNNQMPPLEHSQPNFRDYLDSMTYAMIEGKTGIIGGGIASGLRDDSQEEGGAHVDTVNITLTGNTVVGAESESYRANIYGGGLATDGALSTVGTTNIQIGDSSANGPVINGDIYGGGLALDGMYL